MRIDDFDCWEYDVLNTSYHNEDKTKREASKMDDLAKKKFYQEEIDKLIEGVKDIDLLDLVYKILSSSK